MDARTVMLAAVLAGATALTLAAAPPASPPAGGFVGEFDAATAAYKKKDTSAMEAHLRAALALRPEHPAALYNLAAARALSGHSADAVAMLARLADQGLSFAPDKDADFAALAADSGFKALLARFEKNRQPVGETAQIMQLTDTDFIPEGVAWDQDSGSYYVSGAHERRIARDHRGELDEYFIGARAGGLLAPLGMWADSRRRLLWVATSGIAEMRNAEDKEIGRAGIIAYDLDSGREMRHAWLPADGKKHRLGDVAPGPKGTLFTADSEQGVLYQFDGDHFTALTQPGQLVSPNSVALAADGKTLYVADYPQGLFAYDLEKHTLARLEVSPGVCVYGIHALYRYRDMLVAVQNGVRPHRVVRFTLDDGGKRVKSAYVLAANLREFDEPGLGVVISDRLVFVADSQWHRFDAEHRLPSRSEMRQPVVLRVSLTGGSPGPDEQTRDRRDEPSQQACDPNFDPRCAPQTNPGPIRQILGHGG